MIVAKDANLDVAGRRIMWGKCMNSGQTCIAPDYVLCLKEQRDKLVEALKKTITEFYGEVSFEFYFLLSCEFSEEMSCALIRVLIDRCALIRVLIDRLHSHALIHTYSTHSACIILFPSPHPGPQRVS